VAVGEDSGLVDEAHEIDVAGEQFFWLRAVAIVERVEEVETDGSADQFELGRVVFRSFRGLPDIALLPQFTI